MTTYDDSQRIVCVTNHVKIFHSSLGGVPQVQQFLSDAALTDISTTFDFGHVVPLVQDSPKRIGDIFMTAAAYRQWGTGHLPTEFKMNIVKEECLTYSTTPLPSTLEMTYFSVDTPASTFWRTVSRRYPLLVIMEKYHDTYHHQFSGDSTIIGGEITTARHSTQHASSLPTTVPLLCTTPIHNTQHRQQQQQHHNKRHSARRHARW